MATYADKYQFIILGAYKELEIWYLQLLVIRIEILLIVINIGLLIASDNYIITFNVKSWHKSGKNIGFAIRQSQRHQASM